MLHTVYKSVVVTFLLAIILCGVYPLGVWAFGAVFFSHLANGSLLERDGKVVGSSLIGQNFSKPEYLHGRPSAAGEKGYDSTSSSGSNLGPTSQKLIKTVEANVKAVTLENPGVKKGNVPVDLVTASASGLDPHISPAGAEIQVRRIALNRKTSDNKIREVVGRHTSNALIGIFGEATVNVLETNMDLDATFPVAATRNN